MKLNRLGIAIAALATVAVCLDIAKPAVAATVQLIGLEENNSLVFFDATNPAKQTSLGVTGVTGTLLGIDFRPVNGLLYGLTTTNNLYTINLNTGAATSVGTLSTSFTGGLRSGFDFNPVPDRLRLVGSNDQNLRVNVDGGATIVDGTLAYAVGDPNSGANPNITAAAYTNSFPGGPGPTRTTQLFGIDSTLDTLVLQNPPNNGTLSTIGSLGIDFQETGGFDIFSTGAGVNTAYAASGSDVYTINLASGAATSLGSLGSRRVIGLAARSVPEPTATGALLSLGAVAGLSFYRRRVKSL